MLSRILLTAALTAGVVAPVAHADEKLKGIACRSVHLKYEAPAGTVAFYNEAVARDVAPGTYFMAAGWKGGYFGFQEQGEGRKVVIFSVWDSHTTDDRNAVPDEQRVKPIYNDPEVRVGRFGGEGTGGQSFFKYEWKRGETYRFVVCARAEGESRTQYTGFFYIPETKTWKRLVTFSTPRRFQPLAGLYSFVEDFRRDRVSTTYTRRAEFGPGFTFDGKRWTPVTFSTFTADANPVVNIDSGVAASGRFFLATGGETVNTRTPLRGKTTLAEAPAQPADLADLAKLVEGLPAVGAEPAAK